MEMNGSSVAARLNKHFDLMRAEAAQVRPVLYIECHNRRTWDENHTLGSGNIYQHVILEANTCSEMEEAQTLK